MWLPELSIPTNPGTSITRYAINYYNIRYWTTPNENRVYPGNLQERSKVNIWVGILITRIMGRISIQGHLMGKHSCYFCRTILKAFLKKLQTTNSNELFGK